VDTETGADAATPDAVAGLPRAPDPEVAAALADVDAVGGFFVLATGPEPDDEPTWRPMAALAAGDGPLGGRIDDVAGRMGGAPRRVAGSLLAMSMTSRFTSVLLAAAAVHRVLPDLDDLQWRPWISGPLPLWLEHPTGRALPAPDDPASGAAVAARLDEVVRPLLDAVAAEAGVPPQVLWGNVSSALAGSVRSLATERPATLSAAAALAADVVARPPFAGLGSFVDEPSHPTGLGFARRTCCLYYKVAGGGYCADCVLAD
jgi:hypothetical protein